MTTGIRIDGSRYLLEVDQKKRRNEVWMEWWILLWLMMKYSVLRWIDTLSVIDV
jgi:hypothetical protein